jgi:hypothetical protein
MVKVIAKYNNNRKDQILYEGRNDGYGIYCSLYIQDEDYPYEVIVMEDNGSVNTELFRGNYWEALKWTKR